LGFRVREKNPSVISPLRALSTKYFWASAPKTRKVPRTMVATQPQINGFGGTAPPEMRSRGASQYSHKAKKTKAAFQSGSFTSQPGSGKVQLFKTHITP